MACLSWLPRRRRDDSAPPAPQPLEVTRPRFSAHSAQQRILFANAALLLYFTTYAVEFVSCLIVYMSYLLSDFYADIYLFGTLMAAAGARRPFLPPAS